MDNNKYFKSDNEISLYLEGLVDKWCEVCGRNGYTDLECEKDDFKGEAIKLDTGEVKRFKYCDQCNGLGWLSMHEISPEEYTGIFKSKELAKDYFKLQGFSEEDQDFINNKTDNSDLSVYKSAYSETAPRNGTFFETKRHPPLSEAIELLKKCNYKTSPKTISGYLEAIFGNGTLDKYHWIKTARSYPPRTINSIINKVFSSGKAKNPAGLFNYLIARKKFRNHKIRGNKNPNPNPKIRDYSETTPYVVENGIKISIDDVM